MTDQASTWDVYSRGLQAPNLGAASGCLIIYVVMDEPGAVCPSKAHGGEQPGVLVSFAGCLRRRKASPATVLQTEGWRELQEHSSQRLPF